LLIGNTAERILDDLTCDILVVKPANFRVRIPRAARGARLRPSAPVEALGGTFSYYRGRAACGKSNAPRQSRSGFK
jgi:hypothetical protein